MTTSARAAGCAPCSSPRRCATTSPIRCTRSWASRRETRDRTRSVGARVTADEAFGERARLTAVLEGRAEDFLPRNLLDAAMPVGSPATRETTVAGLELDARIPRARLDILPSARLEATRDVRTGRDNFGANLPPAPADTRALPILRLGLLRALGDAAAVRGNVGYYARTPSFVELYGYNSGVLGNPTLAPERGFNADLGVSSSHEGPHGAVAGSATLFGARVEDLIAWEVFGSQMRAENVSSARIWGLELELRGRTRRLTAVAQATLTDARDEGPIAADHDHQLPHHPRYHGYGRLEWRQPLRRRPRRGRLRRSRRDRRRLLDVERPPAPARASSAWARRSSTRRAACASSPASSTSATRASRTSPVTRFPVALSSSRWNGPA